MAGGLVTLGIDWDFKGTAPTREQISAYTPNATWAIREDCETCPLVLPPARLQSRRFYLHNSDGDYVDRGPCKVWIAGAAPDEKSLEVGEVWVEYDVTMSGTCPA